MNRRTNSTNAIKVPAGSVVAETGERGAALVITLIILALMIVISVSVLAVATSEAGIAGGDLARTQTAYAATSGLEKMTTDFSNLFTKKSTPLTSDLNAIAADAPDGLEGEGFNFNQTFVKDTAKLQARWNTALGTFDPNHVPTVVIPDGPFGGMTAGLVPYQMTSEVNQTGSFKARVKIQREINNYLIPIFQFGAFSDKDLEFWPEPFFSFNGRVHANGNIYVAGNLKFLANVTTANELVRTKMRNNSTWIYDTGGTYPFPRIVVRDAGGTDREVKIGVGSVNNGPSFASTAGARGYHPGSPTGTVNTSWDTTSIELPTATLTENRFGGKLLTRSTKATPLLLPIQIGGSPARDIIKRSTATDSDLLKSSRYHNKSRIRILIDDEGVYASANKAAIPDGKGVELQAPFGNTYNFTPLSLGNGKALWRFSDNGSEIDTASTAPKQASTGNPLAGIVRGAQTTAQSRTVSGVTHVIPPGAGVKARIYIGIVDANGTERDVTKEILSMGMTVGEPNAIVCLQRPLWASFMQGSRDRKTGGTDDNLVSLINNEAVSLGVNKFISADGEIKASAVAVDGLRGFITNVTDDDTGQPLRSNTPPSDTPTTPTAYPNLPLNRIDPINVYNVREGWMNQATGGPEHKVYERGITSVVEINMKNLTRWLDGTYDGNLLSGTQAVSTNIDSTEGYILYISDRRGDLPRSDKLDASAAVTTNNGMADNEDVYGFNQLNGATPDPGEDVIDNGIDGTFDKKNRLQKYTLELVDTTLNQTNTAQNAFPNSYLTPSTLPQNYIANGLSTTPLTHATASNRISRAASVSAFKVRYFRRAVRLFNAEDLDPAGPRNVLSTTKGLTVATENMVYLWGNYNTTGITSQPTGASTLNEPPAPETAKYSGDQIPSSVVSDAFFPLSKTWFDALGAINPQGGNGRIADAGATSSTASDATDSTDIAAPIETAVRAAIISGTTMSACTSTPTCGAVTNGSLTRLNGGVHNFPRFLETWSVSGGAWDKRWNYVGSYILLYYSTQAIAPYSVESSVVYYPPLRNWAFDDAFKNPTRLPPGTPQFQYIEVTGFRQVLN